MKSKLQENFAKYTSIGMDELGGVNRVIGTQAYKDAAAEMQRELASMGMESYIDSVLNVHGIYGAAPGKPEIMIASHLDTVKSGGKFDGLYGVLGGIEAIRRIMEDQEEYPYALHLVATNGEEGNDLGGTFGSRCMVGLVDTEDEAYIALAETFGFSREGLIRAKYDFSNTKYYLELHIEQGNTLDVNHEDIGVVTGIVGLQRYEIDISGMANHAGTTMMEYRDDALVKAAKLISYGDDLARKYPNNFVATFNKMEISPGIVAVISGHVKMVLECRNLKEELMEQFVAEIKKKADELGGITMKPIVKKQPVECENAIIQASLKACEETKVKYRLMPSGATHDGNSYALKVPIGMVFAPSKDGISHARPEYTSWEQCECGIDILYRTLKEIGKNGGQDA